MKLFRIIMIMMIVALPIEGMSQSSKFDKFRDKRHSKVDEFVEKRDNKFEKFRSKLNSKFADDLRGSWHNAPKQEPVKPKQDKKDPPVVYEDKGDERKNRNLPYQSVIPQPVTPSPTPAPIAPIEDDELPVVTVDQWLDFSLYGTPMRVHVNQLPSLRLASANGNDVAQAWLTLSDSPGYTLMLRDCLDLRRSKNLNDWAYLKMVETIANKCFPKGSNEAVLLMAWLYSQSGYKVRIGEALGHLYMLFATNYIIYERAGFMVDGYHYYVYPDPPTNSINISVANFPNEKTLSIDARSIPALAVKSSANRRLSSSKYSDVAATVTTNTNLVDYFNEYPSAMYGDDIMTRWAICSYMPLSDTAKNSLYPAMRAGINGKSELESVERLLNFVQTAFVYEYDTKVWGGDRAFYPEETLFYPYCDCEDRAILFTQMVRDLLGLKTLLVYYPNHLAAAVKFNGNVAGDYIMVDGEKYVVCDPTYINASVGRSMPNLDVSSVIVLKP